MTFNKETGQLEVDNARIGTLGSDATAMFNALRQSYIQAIVEFTNHESAIVKRIERLEKAVFPIG